MYIIKCHQLNMADWLQTNYNYQKYCDYHYYNDYHSHYYCTTVITTTIIIILPPPLILHLPPPLLLLQLNHAQTDTCCQTMQQPSCPLTIQLRLSPSNRTACCRLWTCNYDIQRSFHPVSTHTGGWTVLNMPVTAAIMSSALAP